MNGIRLIAGLGNIGPEYEATRHNAGFWFLDRLAARCAASFGHQTRFFGDTAKASIAGESVWLLKPSTFMNRSGQAVAALAGFYRIPVESILIVHDELDLLPGAAKIKFGGGHAGHNGLKDIQARMGSPNFWRMRLGIGHPRTLSLTQQVIDFVLHRPSREHQALIDEAIDRSLDCVDDMVAGRSEQAMLRLHGATAKDPGAARQLPGSGSAPGR
jgi:PTH1 family peptidyl-tRNA hydrolase